MSLRTKVNTVVHSDQILKMWDFMSGLSASFIKIQQKMKGLCPEQCHLCMAIFNNQGQITPKWLVWSGQNLNLSEILCLSWLPASLTKIQSNNERASVETSFSYCSLWEIFPVLKDT